MPENNYSTYVNYFRHMAISHVELLHDELTEAGKGEIKRRSFGTFNNNDIVSGFTYEFAKTALLVELYDETGNAANIYNIKQLPKGGFMVIAKAAENVFLEMQAAYEKTEAIVYDILKKIYQDHAPGSNRCSTPFASFNFNYEKIATGKVFTSYYGWYVTFDFEFSKAINIATPPEEGRFI